MFIPLHVQSAYTLLQSPMSLEQYVEAAQERGYHALGLADVNVLYGIPEFYRLCRRAGMQPLVGMTVQLPADTAGRPYEEWLIYAKNYAGYQDLMAFSSQLQLSETINAKAALEFIFTHNDNWLTILAPLNGPHMHFVQQGQPQQAVEWLQSIQTYFKPKQLLIGIGTQPHELYHFNTIKHMADTCSIELVPLPNIRYCNSEDVFSVKVLQAIAENRQFEDMAELEDIKGFNYLQTPRAYQAVYDQLTESDNDMLAIFSELAAACQVEMPEKTYLLPKFPLPAATDAQSYLKHLAIQGLNQRVPDCSLAYKERLAYELSIIHKMGFDDYFLIVWDVMRFAHEKKIMTGPGRGSAAGSLVAFSLNITDVDPIANHLLFERFLNPERQNMPDIDLDFPDNQRHHILDYVYKKYGADHVAQIATFGTFAARMSLRNVGSVLGKSQETLKQWANSIPRDPQVTLQTVYEQSSDFRDMIKQEEHGQLWYKTAKQIEGLPRHVSTHAAGVIISDQPLQQYIPLQGNHAQIPLSQYTMGNVEAIGLLKIDFLSLINLTILHDAVTAAEKLAGHALPPLSYNRDDQNVYALFRRAETNGIFQFESEGIRNVLKQVAPTSMEDLAAVNALFRPGPMKQINHFVARKHGQAPITYPHPDLEPILKPTYGVMVYQEQVMQVANKLAGFSLGQADILRRAMGKKNKAAIDEMRDKFISGTLEQGYTQETAEQVYNYIHEFANYGFNRSHAFAYSYLAYQLAWLKTYYPTAFFYGNLINIHIHDTKGKQLFIEANAMGINIIPPDVNESFLNMQIAGAQTIQLGLRDIRGLPRNMCEAIVQMRQNEGRYEGLQDFINRLGTQFRKIELLERLAKANALNGFGYNRRTLIEEALPKMIEHANLFGSDNSQQMSLLSDENQKYTQLFAPVIEPLEEYSDRILMEGEIETLGQTLTVKLYEAYQPFYRENRLTHISKLTEAKKVAIIGEITQLKRITTKNGKPMAFLQLQDETGSLEITAFPDIYIQLAGVLHEGNHVYLYGKTQLRNESLQLILISARPLNEELQTFLSSQLNKAEPGTASSHLPKQACYIDVANRQMATDKKRALLAIIQANQGEMPIHFRLSAESENFWLPAKFSINADPAAIRALTDLFGAENLKIQ